MNTPGNSLGLFNGALNTPGQNFSFADFCNVTPSPGPAQWGSRTPGLAKRLAASVAVVSTSIRWHLPHPVRIYNENHPPVKDWHCSSEKS